MTWIWTGMLVAAVIFALASGSAESVAAAAVSGASQAVELCLSIGGAICLWSGALEVMKRAGLSGKLASLLRRPLQSLFVSARRKDVLEPLAENVSANLLGLGNAATPAGIKAAERMAERLPDGEASDDLCRLVVLNTASLQLVPTSVAAVRAAAGAENAFDILPAVWFTSAVSVTVGIFCAKLLARVWRDKK